jgi:hypothetical protein
VHFQPTGADQYPMQCEQDTWPTWSWGTLQSGECRLSMGYSGGPGIGADCEPTKPICGGNGNWGETQLEIWRLAPSPSPSPPAPPKCCSQCGKHISCGVDCCGGRCAGHRCDHNVLCDHSC